MEANFFSAMFIIPNARSDEAEISPIRGNTPRDLGGYFFSKRKSCETWKSSIHYAQDSVINTIPHQVRISRRAKYVSLRMSLRSGLEVVVPPSYDLRKIPEILESKRKWVETVTNRFNQLPKPAPIEARPTEILLTALSESWRVEYVQTNRRSVIMEECGNQLCVSGKIESDLACRRILRKWLLRKGQTTLIPWLNQISAETGLPFSKAAVRLQRSRWGSCSRRKTISLNAKLLFLAPELVR